MSTRGANIAGRGADWTNGQRDVQKGQQELSRSADRAASAEKAMRKAQQQLSRAQTDRANAERRVASGMEAMRRAEAEYVNIRQQPSALPPR